MSGTRVGSGTCASSAWRTIGASTPSTSSRIALRAGSARRGSMCSASVAAADTDLVCRRICAAEYRLTLRVQAPPQRGDVAPCHRDLGVVAHDEHGGAVEL